MPYRRLSGRHHGQTAPSRIRDVDWRVANLCAGNVELRPWRDADSEAVGASPRDSVVGRYFGRPIGDQRPSPPDPDAPSYAICQAGEPLGRIWFRPGVRPLEVGYFLKPDAWGQGLATAALRLVSDWLLDVEQVERIVLITHPDNLASQRVAIRAGFVVDGLETDYAEFKDGSRDGLRFIRTAAPE
jgi:RimJ/RimL family protein N-acetyltransferase